MSGVNPGEPALLHSDRVDIVKLRPDGSEAATYTGTLIESPPGWIAARATWTFRRMDLGYMVFEPEDYLLEYFSVEEPFNAFALFSPSGTFKGWYCNITYPTKVEGTTIYWHDLYVDVIQRANGEILVLDEDELEDAELRSHDQGLYHLITEARDLVVAKMRSGQYPFSEVALHCT
jgi:uncharacterized protein